jgi:hypothetical protein
MPALKPDGHVILDCQAVIVIQVKFQKARYNVLK